VQLQPTPLPAENQKILPSYFIAITGNGGIIIAVNRYPHQLNT
jgi:hypothetical protein